MKTAVKKRAGRFTKILVSTTGLLSLITPAWASDASWIRSWAAVPSDAIPTTPLGDAYPLQDSTVRTKLRLSAGGSSVRLRLSNALSTEALNIGAVKIALSRGGTIIPGSERTVLFGGVSQHAIAVGEEATSDSVSITVPDLAELVVTIHVTAPITRITAHLDGHETSEIAPGDVTGSFDFGSAPPVFSRYILSGVDVKSDVPAAATTVAFGDSITDGAGSTYGARKRWTDQLADLMAQKGCRGQAIVNAGISGNRILADIFGPSGLSRFKRDALDVPGVRQIVVFEGINDIGMAAAAGEPLPSTAALTAGYKALADAAHARNIRIVAITMAPFRGTAGGYYSDAAEKQRVSVNQWIKTSGVFDSVIDSEDILGAPNDRTALNPAFDSGDHLHPSDLGYSHMANAIFATLFAGKEGCSATTKKP